MPSQRQRIGPPHPSAKMQRAASRVSASSSMNAPPGLGRPATDPESSEARSVDAPRERLERRRVSRTHWRTHRRGGSAGPRAPDGLVGEKSVDRTPFPYPDGPPETYDASPPFFDP